jgi:glycosyltransferase involved in cell wall biosynthesis
MSLLQAMSAGLPSIVTNVGGMAEVVRNADAGLTAPVGDAAAIGEAIVQLASDSVKRSLLAKNARAAYNEHFTLGHMDASYMKLYQRRP